MLVKSGAGHDDRKPLRGGNVVNFSFSPIFSTCWTEEGFVVVCRPDQSPYFSAGEMDVVDRFLSEGRRLGVGTFSALGPAAVADYPVVVTPPCPDRCAVVTPPCPVVTPPC